MNMDEDNIDVDDVQRQSSEVSKLEIAMYGINFYFIYLLYVCIYITLIRSVANLLIANDRMRIYYKFIKL
jgi:hypothetical protein